MLTYVSHALVRAAALVPFLLVVGLGVGFAGHQLDTGDLIDIWEEELSAPNVNSAANCEEFASELADSLGASIQGSVTWVSPTGGGQKECVFVLRFAAPGGEPVLFSPSRNARAAKRHVYVASGYEDYRISFYRAGNSGNNYEDVTFVGGGDGELECLTPSGETFDGPSPCNPELGHGRHAEEDPMVPGSNARGGEGRNGTAAGAQESPGRGRNDDAGAGGKGRGRR